MTPEQLIHDDNIRTTGIIIGIVFIAGNLIEFIYTNLKKKHYYSFQAFVINLSIALLQQLSDVFNKIIFFLGFYYVQQHYSIQKFIGLQEIQADVPFTILNEFPFVSINFYMLFIWLFILVIADFCQYWLHRLSHEVNIMWAGHIVHHSMEEYNYAVALRQSFIESIYTWIFYLPLAFFGIPFSLFIMAYAISLIWQFLVHTRLINKMGYLENIFMTPSHHRVHHGRNTQYIDKNYGALFVFWDKLFGTFEPEVETVDYGITVPVQTQNPVWVNVHHHIHIIKMVFKTSTLENKFKVVFGKPGFVPVDLEQEYQQIKMLQKPDVAVLPTFKNFYILFNFLVTALSGFLLVNYYNDTKDILVFILFGTLVTLSFSINISLLENKKWADYAEIGKLILLIFLGMILTNKVIGITITFTAITMLAYTWFIARSYQRDTSITILQK
jgi:sterol desaturase/sphingolipid hydroxylase (fatty acid hydroxylase superfamily)